MKQLIKPDAIVVVRGAVDKRPGSEEANLIVNELIPLEDLARAIPAACRSACSRKSHGQPKLEQLHEILRGYPGNCEVQLSLCLADGSRVTCKCDSLHLDFSGEMQARVDQLLGPGNFRLVTGSRPGGRRSRQRKTVPAEIAGRKSQSYRSLEVVLPGNELRRHLR